MKNDKPVIFGSTFRRKYDTYLLLFMAHSIFRVGGVIWMSLRLIHFCVDLLKKMRYLVTALLLFMAHNIFMVGGGFGCLSVALSLCCLKL